MRKEKINTKGTGGRERFITPNGKGTIRVLGDQEENGLIRPKEEEGFNN